MAKALYSILLKDADVNRWFNNMARGSSVTSEVYLRRLGAFCLLFKTNPKDLLSKSDEDLHNLILDFITSKEKKGNAGSYIHSTVKAVKSWLSHDRREIKGRVKIKGSQDTPSLKDERIPTKEELKKIFLSGDKKSRVCSVLVAHSGLRIETLGDYKGGDGLKIKDLPEVIIGAHGIEFKKVPTMVSVRKDLSKARHQYFTFLSEEGCEYLKDYLDERIRQGEKITSDSPIITPKRKGKPFIRSVNVGDAIRGAIRKAGFRWRPYVLRSYFDTQLMLAESKGLILRDYRAFFMGHKGDIESRYTTNKNRLSEEVIESMRTAYTKSQDFLQTSKTESTSEDQINQQIRRQFLSMSGYTEEEITRMDPDSMTPEDINLKVKERMLGAMLNNGSKQKVITLNEVENHIGQGWEYVNTIGDKAIMKIPF